jgi:hypothetical protein
MHAPCKIQMKANEKDDSHIAAACLKNEKHAEQKAHN